LNVLDENITEFQAELLRRWRVRFRQIGEDIGRAAMGDEDIMPLLHKLRPVTFFTRDLGFYRAELRHPEYCLVCLAVAGDQAANLIRRFLGHPRFNTQAKRIGHVVRVTHTGLRIWRPRLQKEISQEWLG